MHPAGGTPDAHDVFEMARRRGVEHPESSPPPRLCWVLTSSLALRRCRADQPVRLTVARLHRGCLVRGRGIGVRVPLQVGIIGLGVFCVFTG